MTFHLLHGGGVSGLCQPVAVHFYILFSRLKISNDVQYHKLMFIWEPKVCDGSTLFYCLY